MGIFQNKSCYIIIGASRGIGKSIAINFANEASIDSVVLLMSRDKYALEEVKSEIESSRPKLKVFAQQFDQGQLDEAKEGHLFETVFSQHQLTKENYEQIIIVHNAATLGDNSKFAREFSNIEELISYFTINLTGTIFLNSAFMNFFTQDKCPQRYVVNMSSLSALQPDKNFSLYCTGKAARDMFFKVFAAEDPSVRVLNYAPGPCATDMLVQCRDNSSDPEVKKKFRSLFEDGKVLDCDTSVQKLIQILETNTFVSGSHIDFFDV